jgi:hypothetical protein
LSLLRNPMLHRMLPLSILLLPVAAEEQGFSQAVYG